CILASDFRAATHHPDNTNCIGVKLNSLLVPSILLTGPTACGKSEIAVELGTLIGVEIITVDSMQVYRGLDIGTAKPTKEQLAKVPHHLIDVVDISQPFDVAHYLSLATEAIRVVRAHGRLPLFCGGTGLYFKALIYGIGSAPPPDLKLRAELEATPLTVLLDKLAKLDPETFERIDKQNPRRVIRALEVVLLQGKPLSEQRAKWPAERPPPPLPAQVPLFGIARDPEDLKKRISARVDAMFAQGLVEETERLLALGLAKNKTAMQALGYRQVVDHLLGKRSLEDTIALVKTRTWQFARRQLNWFRHQLPVQWVRVASSETPKHTAERLIRLAGYK
ncbi:MAG: tRNA (adenosine(37)-N6)-dimethylallyltransferase MiaA, partial [Verrucomicrobiae bacterium]|nr:tRNA (adenosine(37)-N6)-dimethylallyltransferase MiaA [Verrucomicrobiae bacterium]